MVGQPIHWLAAFGAGALGSSVFPQSWMPLLAIALIGILLISIWSKAHQWQSLFGSWCCFFLGSTWVALHWWQVTEVALPESQPPYVADVAGEVSQLTEVGVNQGGLHYVGFILTVDDPLASKLAKGAQVQVRCYRCSLNIDSGERRRFKLKLRPILSFKNPGGFDYRHWLMVKGVAAQGYVIQSKAALNEKLAEPSWISKWFSNHRHRVRALVVKAHGQGYLSALLLGTKQGLNAEDKRLMMHAGLGHLFVVSGLHVALVAFIFSFLLQPVLRPLVLLGLTNVRPFSWLAGVSMALMYAWLTGFQVPAMRAIAMLAIGLLFFLMRRHQFPMYFFVLALVVVVLIEPLAFKSMGSWLSFGIVSALIWGFWGRDSNQGVRHWFINLGKSQFYAFCAGAVVLIAFALPISLPGILLNLILIPVFSLVILPLSLVGLLYGLGLDDPKILDMAGALISHIFQWLDHFQFGLKFQLTTHNDASWLAMVGFVVLLVPLGWKLRWVGLLAIMTAACIPAKRIESGTVVISVLDVGQGSSALIRTQNHSMLVDTGRAFTSGMTVSDFVVMPYLRRMDVDYLDQILVSHNDQDHMGGLEVLKRWGPKVGSVTTQSECSYARWEWDEIEFERMQASAFKVGNDGSCVLKVTTAKGSVLIAGDIEQPAEQQLIEDGYNLEADVLVVPHHGSRTSSSESWLAKIKPSLGIVSAGRFNRYGHPHAEIVERYDRLNVALLGTYSHGAIEVVIGAGQNGIKVSTYAPSTVSIVTHK